MKDIEINIAIAEACGLFRIEPIRRTTRKGRPSPDGVRLWYCDSHHGGAATYVEVPDYINNLNAMHEAEKELTDSQYRNYCALLDDSGIDERGLGYPNWSRSATARQRAEAFLRTVGKWKEDN